jgi:protein phosphatase
MRMKRANANDGGLRHTCEQFRWTSASCSHVGLVRKINEDACLDRPELGLWAVADGMGGHTVGDLASRRVIETLSTVSSSDHPESFVHATRERLQAVNQELRAEAATRDVERIGSTVVVLLACDRHCRYLWAGDSRIYLYRSGRLKLLTRDHSVLQELKSRGHLISADALPGPAQHGITRAVGAADILALDEGVEEVSDGDIFLLCSDGLSNELSEEEISSALRAGNCRQPSEVLVEMALERGGRDNISAVVVRADDVFSSEKTLFNPAL